MIFHACKKHGIPDGRNISAAESKRVEQAAREVAESLRQLGWLKELAKMQRQDILAFSAIDPEFLEIVCAMYETGKTLMNKPLAFLTILLLLASAAIAKKPLQWKTGKVLDTQRNRYFAGSVVYGAGRSAVYRVFGTFVIEGEDYAYEASERVPWHRFANLTVNGPVKYAVDGRKLIVIDDDGKQHAMEIVKRILKPKDGNAR
jgi:hypothetical protein